MSRFSGSPAHRSILVVVLVSLLLGGLALLGWQLVNDTASADPGDRRLPPAPNAAPPISSLGAVPASDKYTRMEERLRRAIDNIPSDRKIWIDLDTVVYLLPRDPHDFSGEVVAVAHHLPTGAARTYAAPGEDAFAEDVAHHPDARMASDQMSLDPEVSKAVTTLLGGE